MRPSFYHSLLKLVSRNDPKLLPFVKNPNFIPHHNQRGISRIPTIVESPTFLNFIASSYTSCASLDFEKKQLLHKDNLGVGSSNGRMLLIDGTPVIYRAYYTILAKRNLGFLNNVDANGDWVLTIFEALSIIIDVLKLIPSHAVVVFDHDGTPLGKGNHSLRHGIVAMGNKIKKRRKRRKGKSFRHDMYPLYKKNRCPTPDAIAHGRQYLKAAISSMSIKVIEVPGVEADDVIGTLAVKSVAAGFKVRVVSRDKDFFQILSPSLRLLRHASRGVGITSFGIEEFAEKYGGLRPEQFVDVMSLAGDSCDNVPGVAGIGNRHALRLITEFGTLENLLNNIERVKEGKIKEALISSAEQAILSKRLAQLCCDLPRKKVPYTIEDLKFTKPEDDGKEFSNLLRAIAAYAEGSSADNIIRDFVNLWRKLEKC